MKARLPWLVLALTSLVAACSGGGGTAHTTGTGAGGGGGSGGAEAGGAGGTSKTTSSTGTHGSTTSSSTTTSTSGAMGGAGGGTGSGGAGGGMFDCSVLGVPGNCMETSACSAMASHAPTAGFCPGAADIECCIPDQLGLCDPSVIVFPNAGNTTEAPGEGNCPAGMVPVTTALPSGVAAFCVDRYEASLVRDDDGSSWSPFINPGATKVRAVSVGGAVPQGYIDGIQAGDACANAGKRLCSNTEWLRACRGPNDTTYPYGNTKELGVCNDHRDVHPAVEYFGTSANWIWSEIDNACIDQLPETVDPTGSRTGCVTAEGAFDMMGNLHEWTSDPAGTFRGGYYVDTVENGPGCLYVTTAHDTSHWDYSTGFRCCADPLP